MMWLRLLGSKDVKRTSNIQIYLCTLCIEMLICIEKCCLIKPPTTQNSMFTCKIYLSADYKWYTEKTDTNYNIDGRWQLTVLVCPSVLAYFRPHFCFSLGLFCICIQLSRKIPQISLYQFFTFRIIPFILQKNSANYPLLILCISHFTIAIQ